MRHDPRRGFALLAAIVMLALASAVVVGTFSLSRALRRAATTTRARARVESGVTRALGESLQGWNSGFDSLPAGTSVAVLLSTDTLEPGLPMTRRARVSHVGMGLYAVGVEICVPDCAHPIAQRRARLWLQRNAADADSVRPALVTPWAFSDLY